VRFFKSWSSTSESKPEAYTGKHEAEIGPIAIEFEAFKPNPAFADTSNPGPHHVYPPILPRAGTSPPPIDPILKSFLDSMWQRAEPATGATRGVNLIGTRSGQVTPQRDAYAKQTRGAMVRDFSNTNNLKRTDAITFRGDSRGPQEILVGNGKSGGFNPPNTRTDDGYLYGSIFSGFQSYMKSRFKTDITMADFVSAVNGSAPSPAAKHVLADYLMWRMVMESEALHIGTMVQSEFLKAYVSTSSSLLVSKVFAGMHASGSRTGWLYICRVRGGFVIPAAGTLWGKGEQEIAQLGPISPRDIIGFAKVAAGVSPWASDGPIYVRRDFRKGAPDSFSRMYNMLSGWVP
jgi:hypothetical protein